MTLVVDASVAAKWVLPESDSAQAVAIRMADEELVAPSIAWAEIGNAIWKAVRRRDLAARDAAETLRVAMAHYARLVPLDECAVRAIELATSLRHPIYDCFYLALAECDNVPLVTADETMFAAARRIKIKVRRL